MTTGFGSVLPELSLSLLGYPLRLLKSFCGNALYRDEARTYLAFDQPHLGLGTKGFDGPMLIEDIFYLGDTRSADDLAVFTGT